MKYFTPDLWINIHNEDKEISCNAASEWGENNERYKIQFSKVAQKFTKNFLKTYEQNGCFHDWYINSYNFVNTIDKRKDCFTLTVSNEILEYQMIFYNVKNLKVNFHPEKNFALYKKDQYAYDEWDLTETGMLHYELLQLSLSTIELTCSHVRIIK